MDRTDVMGILKTDLHISVDETSTRGGQIITLLDSLISKAEAEISIFGITLDYNDVGDVMLVESYTAWMYRVRNQLTGNNAMPDYLRLSMNNRLFHEKAGESNA